MQIHELNTFVGNPGETDFLAIDSGFDTAKISAKRFLEKKINQPLDENNQPTDGAAGQLLRTKGDGSTEWSNVGQPTDAQTAQAVSDWLDAHPEATTTVQDGSLTDAKFSNDLKLQTFNSYVTPQMFGAVGDGVVDDTTAIKDALDYCKTNNTALYFPKGFYLVTENISVDFSVKISGHLIATQNTKSRLRASTIVDGRPSTNGFLFTFNTDNTGCIEIKDIRFKGNESNGNGLNFLNAGWTLTLFNVAIEYFGGTGIKFEANYDSNIYGLTINHCGFLYENSTPTYAMVITDSTVGQQTDNSNAIHFVNLHMENCRYFIEFDSARHISFTNGKFEVGSNGYNSDGSNPYIYINSNETREIAFDNTSFIGGGDYGWKIVLGSYSNVPSWFKLYGSGNAENVLIIQGCIFTSLGTGGGLRVIDSVPSLTDVQIIISSCSIEYACLTNPAFNCANIKITNCNIFYTVGLSETTATAVSSVLDEKSFFIGNKIGITQSATAKLTNGNPKLFTYSEYCVFQHNIFNSGSDLNKDDYYPTVSASGNVKSCNDALTTGIWYVASSATDKPSGWASGFMFVLRRGNSSNMTQLAIGKGSTPDAVYNQVRHSGDGGSSWGSWVSI